MHSRLNGQLFAEKPIHCVAPARVQSINESLFVGRHLLILEDCGKSTSSFLLLQRDLADFSNPHEHHSDCNLKIWCETTLIMANFHHNFKFYYHSEPANGILSLQMVGDAMLSFYSNTQAASATKVSLWLTDNSTGSECGKPRSTCYSHWLKGTCHWHKNNSTIIALSTWVKQ